MTERYVELHAASAFSFLEGASQPETLIERAAELEMPAMALLDRNGVYGSARFIPAQRKRVRAHVGAEIAVKDLGPRLTPPAWLPHQHVSRTCPSAAALRIPPGLSESVPARDPVQDARNRERAKAPRTSMICNNTPLGWSVSPAATKARLPRHLCNGGEKAGVRHRRTTDLASLAARMSTSSCSAIASAKRSGATRRRSASRRSLNLPVVATNGVRYARAYDREVLDIFTAIRHHTDLDHAGRLLTHQRQRHLRSAREMTHYSAISRRRSQIPMSCPRACSSSWTILATSFLAIPYPRARRWIASCASASTRGLSAATGRRTTQNCWNVRRSRLSTS